MASVSSLDQDMRKLRFDRYTPAAIAETRAWLESTLGESLAPGDLLDALKDGVALCKLANMILPPPGIKYKVSDMPFTQRENISSFLTACERDPLSLPGHDRFLTVDLYDNKDPAQVLQCIGAFSRAANAANPSRFPTVIGPKRQASPTRNPPLQADGISRGISNASQESTSALASHRPLTPTSPGSGTGQSKKSDEPSAAPAWHLQYGYMGGASQGNQGVSFGARRQIISPDVHVPSLAEKEKMRREKENEMERLKLEAQAIEAKRIADLQAQERQAQMEEEERWEEETRKARDRERQLLEEDKRKWEEEERRWKEEDEQRRREEQDNYTPVQRKPALQGQYLSQYQSEQRNTPPNLNEQASNEDRIQELERQLGEARERERKYELERQQRIGRPREQTQETEAVDSAVSYRRPLSLSPSRQPQPSSPSQATTLLEANTETPLSSSRPLPQPPTTSSALATTPQSIGRGPSQTQRPLPDPVKSSITTTATTTSSSPSPFTRATPSPFGRSTSPAKTHVPAEMSFSSTSEQAAEDAKRVASQAKTKAGGLASKSLLEREMERERERQREWEQNQIARSEAQPPAAGFSGRVQGPR